MSVANSFSQIKSWCENNAPSTAAALHGPATDAELSLAQQETKQDWPTALLELYRQSSGAEFGLAYLFVHGFFPLLGTAVSTWKDQVSSWETDGPTDSLRQLVVGEGAPEEAGSDAFAWLRPYLPFGANGDGGYLFVDTRPGLHTGCVRQWEDVDRDGGASLGWESLDELLEQVAAVLVGGEDLFEEQALVENGFLTWRFEV